MRIWKEIRWILGMDEEGREKENKERMDPFKKRYEAFRALLMGNNAVLETMADMEEKLSGEYLFDRHYVESNVQKVKDSVRSIIDSLNYITRNKYAALNERYAGITAQIDYDLASRHEIPVSAHIITFDELTRDYSDRVGSKSANLGEMKKRLFVPVPQGFAISAYAFKKFMDYNGLPQRIHDRLDNLAINDIEALNAASREIQALVIAGEVPPDVAQDIAQAYERLKERVGAEVKVSVRSSAYQEDGDFSFAGQYATFLNVPGGQILQRYKEVMASLFSQRALFYFKTKGLQESDMVMPVGVLSMVNARTGGVMYTRDPNEPDKDMIMISAVRGLGTGVVDGTQSPETYFVAREGDLDILERRPSHQEKMSLCRDEGGIEDVPLGESERQAPFLNDNEVKLLARYALSLERHFKSPQDIEWAIDLNGRVFILQTRPLRLLVKETAKPVPRRVEGYRLLIEKGVIACKGIGFGKVHVVRRDEDLADFPDGGVLVAKHTSTKFVTVMNRASAIVTDVGSSTGHMASLSREFGVPTILDAETATSVMQNGQDVTVDAVNCNVYEGRVAELEEFAGKKDESFKETQLFRILDKVLKKVTPLNLIDPDSEDFKPESCRTYHDITRYCHEMVVRELFNIVDTSADDVSSVRLVSGMPVEIWLLDLGGGIEGAPKYLNPEHLRSIPFNAFLKGLMSMKWPEARAFDVKGFLGAVAHTATTSEEELQKTAEKSFSFITDTYMNFAIRLGYHLSTVEAFVGDNINDNYIRFHFKGGGAVVDRRLRRVRLITEILKRMDFNVKITGDVIDASLMKYKRETLERKLESMGKMTVFTKQLDMVMYNDAITDSYIKEFCKKHLIAE